jgi:hypothetical protein
MVSFQILGASQDVKEEQKKFEEINKKIKEEKQSINLLVKKSETITNQLSIAKNKLQILQEEANEIEKILISKHKKTFIAGTKIDKLLIAFRTMTDKEKINYLLNNKNAYELFTSIDFENLIEQREVKEDEDVNEI